jgi:hypothetical protein
MPTRHNKPKRLTPACPTRRGAMPELPDPETREQFVQRKEAARQKITQALAEVYDGEWSDEMHKLHFPAGNDSFSFYELFSSYALRQDPAAEAYVMLSRRDYERVKMFGADVDSAEQRHVTEGPYRDAMEALHDLLDAFPTLPSATRSRVIAAAQQLARDSHSYIVPMRRGQWEQLKELLEANGPADTADLVTAFLSDPLAVAESVALATRTWKITHADRQRWAQLRNRRIAVRMRLQKRGAR